MGTSGSNPSAHELNAGQIYRRLLGYCLPHWRVFLVAALGMAVYAATDTGFAYLINKLIGAIGAPPAAEEPYQELIRRWLPLGILLLFLVRGTGEFAATYGIGWIGRQIIKKLRGEVFTKFLDLPTRFFDTTVAGMQLSKLTFNIEQVADATSNVVTVLIRDSLTTVGLIGYMIYLSPVLTAFVFVAAPVLALLIRTLARMFRRHSTRIQESMGDLTRITTEVLQSHRIIKIFNGQEYEAQRFETANENNRRMNMRLFATKAIGDGITVFLAAVGLAGVVYVATQDSVRNALDVGDFGGFIAALLLLMRPLKALTNVNAALQRGIAGGASVFRLLDEDGERDTGVLAPARVSGKVEFRNVSFGYGDQASILHDIDLTVPAGQTLAIVGRSGSGKSSLVGLLPRFYDVDSGVILVDDQPLGDYSLSALRNQISLVSQEVVLFNDTIAGNIAYGSCQNAARADIEAAARAAHVDEFAAQLPDGLDTWVGDRGVLLSGGQRQRIAIARALLKNAPILILDEATSALDTESERRIQAALAHLMKNRTTFVIAHRLSTIENADRIIVMSDGRIVEAGSHPELLAAGGHYANLHRLQFRDDAV
ncbi:MAG: lipid A export permease/ATP-binding protein MsbA [Gammaproteobacteria bacterium]|nr:lipid A export permease/ATP-binding protein MsbA [Gammaproteobacteria bacterium]